MTEYMQGLVRLAKRIRLRLEARAIPYPQLSSVIEQNFTSSGVDQKNCASVVAGGLARLRQADVLEIDMTLRKLVSRQGQFENSRLELLEGCYERYIEDALSVKGIPTRHMECAPDKALRPSTVKLEGLPTGIIVSELERRPVETWNTLVLSVPTADLLAELSRRGGHPGAIADAVLLVIKKSADYNHGKTDDPHTVDRSDYFPFGDASYAQMIHTKAMRFVSLTRKEMDGGAPNFEGLRDTAMDLVNYAGFFLAENGGG